MSEWSRSLPEIGLRDIGKFFFEAAHAWSCHPTSYVIPHSDTKVFSIGYHTDKFPIKLRFLLWRLLRNDYCTLMTLQDQAIDVQVYYQ